jgi:hypothetical protein
MKTYNITTIWVLLEEHLVDGELTKICQCNFEEVYEKFTSCQTKDQRISLLIEHAKTRLRIPDLLNCISEINYNAYTQFSSDLYIINDQENSLSRTSNTYQFPSVSSFDLNEIIKQSSRIVIQTKGLVALPISCRDNYFITHFCERLKQELGRMNTEVGNPILLNYKTNIGRIVEIIRGHQKRINNKNIIFPLNIEMSDPNSTILNDLWIELQKLFQDELNHSIVVAMFGDRDYVFPSEVPQIDPPSFEYFDVFQWIRSVTEAKGWTEVVRDKWTDQVVARSTDSHPDLLDVNLLYYHLEDTFAWLQQNPLMSQQDFLQYLE